MPYTSPHPPQTWLDDPIEIDGVEYTAACVWACPDLDEPADRLTCLGRRVGTSAGAATYRRVRPEDLTDEQLCRVWDALAESRDLGEGEPEGWRMDDVG